MKHPSILNHVLGPVMRGPSSSHTAGAYHIACMGRSMLGGQPRSAVFAFDPGGSYAHTYASQGADRAFAMGLVGRPLTDDSFFTVLDEVQQLGLDLRFEVRKLSQANHPNSVDIELRSQDGTTLRLLARSIGGGDVQIDQVNGWPTSLDGTAHEILVEVPPAAARQASAILRDGEASLAEPETVARRGTVLLLARRSAPLGPDARKALEEHSGRIWASEPVYFVQTGRPLFRSASEMVLAARERRESLGETALAYEAELLGMSRGAVLDETLHRYEIMEDAVRRGLDPQFQGMQLLSASAGAIFEAEARGRLSVRSLHTRAAARAMAVMHVSSAMGVVCAAPTGGSAGALPGALVTLAEERKLGREEVARALLAAGAIGVIVAARATFAAEVAGCQVEIGAAGAMAAAAMVEGSGGTAQQAADAAAISFQNTMGSVCDLVQGMVEIPCHTRNAAAASSAFVCADLVLGGYSNPIPLDETIDAVHAVGQMLPPELRCTARGGLAVTPSAKQLPSRSKSPGCGRC